MTDFEVQVFLRSGNTGKQWLYFTKQNVLKFQRGFNQYVSMILSGYDKLSQIKRLWIIELIHLLALSKARNVYFNAIWIRLCTQWPNQLKFNHKLQKRDTQMYPVFNDCTITIQFRHEQSSPPCWLRVSKLSQAVIWVGGQNIGLLLKQAASQTGSRDKVLWSHSDLTLHWDFLVILLTLRVAYEVSTNL